MAYMVQAVVSTNDAVKASYNNQLIENLEVVRGGELKVPYGTGNDFMGIKLIVETSPFSVRWYAKANTEPENITAVNADEVLDFAGKDPQASDIDF